ncbi:Inner membrane ABC transporter permease protein YcjP [Paenibacillus plantiphilus]|uniref:Inner membrane ABC transporter permease protein YcjP n=1 Tax=Paenibacillus plantiphilus TaxID=2905650 RepID=A0ABN8G787_9BACL|nr:carbohydrate ABC transporter permease [Paenibacillus plantiphilus]CAH1199281.1 Inner membrane ABC transporter permease protein YcjP [Paenibacillus plantiphilus]
MKETLSYRTLKYMSLLVLMVCTLFPFLWLVDTTFKSTEEMFASTPSWWIENFTLEHYTWALGEQGMNIGKLLTNSIIVCTLTALCTGLIACLSGYGLARFQVPGIKLVIILFVLAQMIQGPLIMIPWYELASTFSLLNTKTVLVLIYNTMTIPVGVWIMSGFFKTVPKELEEAAYMDGSTKLKTLFKIMVPMALPGLVSISLYSFILGWNDYQYSLILTNSLAAKTVQVGIAEVMESMGAANWGGILASGVIVILPIVIIFAFIQKLLIEGLTAGGIKG